MGIMAYSLLWVLRIYILWSLFGYFGATVSIVWAHAHYMGLGV